MPSHQSANNADPVGFGKSDPTSISASEPLSPPTYLFLAYHEIFDGPSPYLYGVSRDAFERHLETIRELRSQSVCNVRLTFDDGHISHADSVLPLLERYSAKATFFVTVAWTGTNEQYMDWPALKELLSTGHQVQSHTWSHKMLTTCSSEELRKELEQSKVYLEDRLGIAVRAISIPHGRWNQRVLDACAQAGYTQVYVSDPWIRMSSKQGLHVLGRIMIKRTMDTATLQTLLEQGARALAGPTLLDRAKSAASVVLGDRLYHQIWRKMAKDVIRCDNAVQSRRPLTVLHLISSAGFYGAESMVATLAGTLHSRGDRPVLTVFRNSHNPHTEVATLAAQKDISVEILECRGRLDFTATRRVRRLIAQYGVDIVHAHGYKANFYAMASTALTRKPLMATYHGWPDTGVRLHIYRSLERLLLRRFQSVVAVSKGIERSLLRAGLSKKKLTVVNNGVDLSPFLSLQADPGRPLLRTEKIVIGVVARLTLQKGHKYLLAAAPKILSRFPNVQFLFVGDGPERESLLSTVRSLGLSDAVLFAGHRTDMPEVLASINIVALPSLNEGMPMALLEALAAGKPVIASNVGAVAELIRHERTGLLIEPANSEALCSALLDLLEDAGKRSALAREGRNWVCEHFSAEEMTRKYQDIYRSMLTSSNSHSERIAATQPLPK